MGSSPRTRVFFAPLANRIRVSGRASGYPAGTPVKAFMPIGTARWREITNARLRTDAEGRLVITQTLGPLYVRRTVSVRFEIGDPEVCAPSSPTTPACGTTETVLIPRIR